MYEGFEGFEGDERNEYLGSEQNNYGYEQSQSRQNAYYEDQEWN